MRISRQLEPSLVSCAIALVCTLACSREEPGVEQDPAEPVVGATPTPNELPQLTLTDDTPDLLLTWIDAKGDFHVVTKTSEVPAEGREQVRVVVTTKEEGVGRLVYVADLRNKQADGTYPVKTLTRAQWNDIGAERRKVRMEAVSRAEPAAEAPVDEGKSGHVSAEEKKLNARVRAVVYGADWCKPCHDAEDYLKELGVNVTKKDIEESRAARAEMNEKLAEAGRMGASIPVLDVGGKVLIGFSRPTVKQAVIAARKPETL